MADSEYNQSDEFDDSFESEESDEEKSGPDSLNKSLNKEHTGKVDIEGQDYLEVTQQQTEDDSGEEEEDENFTRPEVLLARLRKENIDLDFNTAKINKIKSLALCKIIYGERHWKVAEAHVELANVYLKGKYFPHQTLKHANLARANLLVSNESESFDMEYILQNLYYLMGRANFQLTKFKVAENCLQKAKLVSEKSNNATSKYMNMKVTILTYLASTVGKLGQLGQAVEYLEESIDLLKRMSGDNSIMTVKLYKQLANLELLNGKHANFSSALEALNKAINLCIDSSGKNCNETAEIYILISRVEAQKEMPDFSKVENFIQEALGIYSNIENRDKIVSAQQMLCKILMQQDKFSEAKLILTKSIEECEELTGDMSLESAELYELMGSLLFTLGKMSNALTYFMKAEEIYKGKKRHLKKQQNIVKAIEIIRKTTKDEKLKTSSDKLKGRPRFF